MTFSDFANMLGQVLRKEENTVRFTRTLFEAILPEEKCYLLEGIADDTFKSYYNGSTGVTVLARKINADVKVEAFAKFIKAQGKVTVQKLCENFSNVLPEIDVNNTCKMIAELFDKIIMEAAAVKRERNKTSMKESISAEKLTENQNHVQKTGRCMVVEQNQSYSGKSEGADEAYEQFVEVHEVNDEECKKKKKFGNVYMTQHAKSMTNVGKVETLTINMN